MPRLADTQPSHYLQHQPQSHAYAHAPLPDNAPQQPAQGYQSRQVSPLSTSNNTGSPTSPKPYQRQRLRPLYMPAVLRPTEHPYKRGHGAKNEAEPQTLIQDDERPMSSANSFISLPGLGGWGRLSRRSTGDSAQSIESEWDLNLFPKPTSPPTRQHWKELTLRFSPTRKPQFATNPPAYATSTTGRGGTTAEDAGISSAINIPPSSSHSTKMQTTTPREL
ncbi:hypothetical protein ONZ43_g4893 [Nemania bipapillata]|uniref:Uncharacterized protein n=1 Tax=Nemania bipapillata TaxID=110536 RepID=A0ACC2IH52_9PEZI|nr:hypothetical protein ONZ43_g4893 [Nemania bipapillata]